MQSIPVIPATTTADKELKVGHLSFSGIRPMISDDLDDYEEYTSKIVSNSDEKLPVLVVDVNGLRNSTINDVLMKGMKIRKTQLWFMTCVETVDDIFDAFNTYADIVLMPYHMIRSEKELDDIISISDSAMPAIFVIDGLAQCRKGTTDPEKLAEHLFDKGFVSIPVFDLTNSLTSEDWKALASLGRIIPYTQRPSGTELFENTDIEWRFRSDL